MTRAAAPVALAVVCLLLVATRAASAQQPLAPTALVEGAKVRLEWLSQGGPTRGTVSGEPADSAGFLMRPSNRDAQLRVPFAALESLQVRTSRNSRWEFGLLIGLVAGALVPSLAPDNGHDDQLRSLPSAIPAAIGAILGAAVGYFIVSETWSPVMLR